MPQTPWLSELKFGSSALRYWAEKWSSRFGKWIYDELFGYVWEPIDETFAYSARPFFHAEYVRINGQLFLVPQETWGWVPAHMGTWVWLKRGWTWVPGNMFHSGVVDFDVRNGHFFPDFDYYFWYAYGGFDLYRIYREYGNEVWGEHYYRKHHRHHKRPRVKDLPRELQKIIKQINKVPLAVVAKRLNAGRTLSEFAAKKTPLPDVSRKADLSDKGILPKLPAPDLIVSAKGKTEANDALKNLARLDWNPDNRWAAKHGYSINYSSSRNAVLCPELNISSDREHLSNRAGAAGFVLHSQDYIPGNYSQPDNNSAISDGTATRATATDANSGKQDDSGK